MIILNKHRINKITNGTGVTLDIKNGVLTVNFTGSDIVDLSTHNVTELSDVSSAGSGTIISDAERTKLSGIATSAEVNVQSDWNAVAGDALILNKPTTISGYAISDTKANFNTALSDGTFLYVGDADNYASWKLKVGGVLQDSVTSGFNLDIIQGDRVTLGYAGQALTITADVQAGTTYTCDFPLLLTGTVFSLKYEPTIFELDAQNELNIKASSIADGKLTEDYLKNSEGYTQTQIDTWRSSVTQEEMGWVHGITSDVQDQLTARAVISGTPANNRLAVWTSATAIEGEAKLTFDGATLAITGAATWTGGGSVNANTAYSHSQDNSQAHTDYLINNGNDSTSGSLTATGFLVGTDEVFNEGDEDWQTDATTTPTMNLSTSRNMELTPATNATTLAFSNPHDGLTGIIIIDASDNGVLTLPATSIPTTIAYATTSRVVASFVKYGSEYIWQSTTFANAAV